ncbi:hypothetical protein D9615_000386 [Tricholomella constricta]|uniref:RNA polymerase II assembly factor Rtp1 C-terminal domain-containing protein n=1 Tax=Tricholomella constricta TaxID=117010 RepID=A0A8H5HQD8_9AGAR|nr:hypothetical protein D9615_000386 [Tricholomella constricta]
MTEFQSSSPQSLMSDLSTALFDGACLIDSTGSAFDLKSVLVGRLSRYYARRGAGDISDSASLEDVQLLTAREALSVITRIQNIIGMEERPGVHQAPLIGTRDLAELRTLLSIVFKWGVDPLLIKVMLASPDKVVVRGQTRVIDLTTSPEDNALLASITHAILRLVFPDGYEGRIAQTLITTTILERHAMDLLKPSFTLGWLPKSLASDLRPVLDVARPLTMRLLNLLSPLQTITALGGILTSSPPPLPHVRKLCASLLGQQLLRPQGVLGLCAAVFGEDGTDDSSVEKLQHITRVFTTVPANMKPEDYFSNIIPKIIHLLSPQASNTDKRAAAYVISRMLSADDPSPHKDLTSKIIFSILHHPFLRVPHENKGGMIDSSPSSTPTSLTPSVALSILTTLVSNADPSPTLISALLSPIVPALYSLLYHMDEIKTTDPSLRESLRGLLVTWAKIIGTSDGVSILWSVLESDDIGWAIDIEGNINRDKASEKLAPLSLLTPKDLKPDEGEDFNIDSNILGLYPDPTHFVQFLKTIARADISSDLFVQSLEAYREAKFQGEEDPTKMLLYLQTIMQMQMHLTDGKSSSNILYNPLHLLSFVKHVLEPSATPHRQDQQRTRSSGKDHLRFYAGSDDGLSDEADSDDDTPGADIITADGEMIETSINLLLSILEANEDLSARTAPVLNDICSLLEPLAREGSMTVRAIAREARMVMTARLASTSIGKMASHAQVKESAYDIYQKALKLLQDPILPVRAHGLLLLRQLVTPASRDSEDPKLDDYALVPAILSIFVQSVQDDDSYVFLNAVQGLAAMVDRFGKDVLKGLIKEYADGLDGLGATVMTQRDLDLRTRVGEALAAVIRRCGEALGNYVDILVPPLFKILRLRHIPTVLRTSSLSLLSDCESVGPLAMLPYVTDLAEAMIDILQIETVPARPESSATPEDAKDQLPTMDSEPTSTNPKFPPLRRAALNFLSLLIRETTKQIYDSSFGRSVFSDDFMRRGKTTLSYVASTDDDNVVRVMAREAVEGLNEMNQAIFGF